MKFFEVFVVIGALVIIAYAKHDPDERFNLMIALYYPLENIYELTDYKITQKILSSSKLTKGNFSHILLFCRNPPKPRWAQNFTISLRKIIPYTQRVSIAKQVTCSKHHIPVKIPNSPTPSLVEVGYEIFMKTNTRKFTRPYGLPDFSLDKNEEATVVFQNYYTNTFPERLHHTIHRIHSYKLALRSDKCCVNYNHYFSEHALKRNLLDEVSSTAKKLPPERGVFGHYRFPTANTPDENKLREDFFLYYRFIPLEDFIDDTKRMTTCLAENPRIPIWKSIIEGSIAKTEQFITKVAQKLKIGTLTIRTQPVDQLILPMWTGEEKPVYINPVIKEYPVYKNIVKIISYRGSFNENQKIDYYIIIVIQNQIPATNERICNKRKSDICQQNGWHLVEDESGSIYCCTFDDEHLKENKFIEIDGAHKPLNLFQLVTHVDDNGEILNTVNIAETLQVKRSEATTSNDA